MTFEKQIKTIEDQGKKKVDALENLKSEEEIKPNEDESNNQPKSTIIFHELINKRKGLMKELYDNVDYNNLIFKYVSQSNDVSFYDLLQNKISNVKIGEKTDMQNEVIFNLEHFYISREEVINFFRNYGKMVLDAAYRSEQNKSKGKELKILTLKHLLQRLPIALAQIKAGNNSASLLNEIRQIVYSLYQSEQITKKVYNNIIKSINV